jgi:hypothetical protein
MIELICVGVVLGSVAVGAVASYFWTCDLCIKSSDKRAESIHSLYRDQRREAAGAAMKAGRVGYEVGLAEGLRRGRDDLIGSIRGIIPEFRPPEE